MKKVICTSANVIMGHMGYPRCLIYSENASGAVMLSG